MSRVSSQSAREIRTPDGQLIDIAAVIRDKAPLEVAQDALDRALRDASAQTAGIEIRGHINPDGGISIGSWKNISPDNPVPADWWVEPEPELPEGIEVPGDS